MKTTRSSMAYRLVLLLLVSALLPACSPVGGDQPRVQQLSKEQAAKKAMIDDNMRTRLRTTQSDR